MTTNNNIYKIILHSMLSTISFWIWYLIYLLTAIGLTPGGSSTVHIYTKTIHRTTKLTTRTTQLTTEQHN